MNKRQAKKAFKKKYGVNPNQLKQALIDFDWDKFTQDLIEASNRAARMIAETMETVSKRLAAIDWQEVLKNEQINITNE